jgi:solute carrier family 25 protein 38
MTLSLSASTPSSSSSSTNWERALRRFLAGALSGTFVSALTQPFDVVKTTQQSLRMGGEIKLRSSFCVASDVYTREGIRGLYAGLGATIVRVFFGAGIYFTSLHAMADILGNSPASAFLAGASARALAVALLAPVSVLKTRLEVRGLERGTSLRGLSEFRALGVLAKSEGIATLFSGLVPTLLRDAPFSGIYVSAYYALRDVAGINTTTTSTTTSSSSSSKHGDSSLKRTLLIFTTGLTAGAFATAVTHPFDVLKTRLQLRPAAGRFVSGSVILEEAMTLFSQQGIKGFFAGFGARVTKRTLSTALTWTLFEEGMRERG